MSDSPSNGNGNSAFGDWVVRYRWLVLFASLAVAMVAGSGGSRLAFNNDYRVFFSEDNPELQAFEKLQRTYTKIDNILSRSHHVAMMCSRRPYSTQSSI